jgi:hypothetical protein
MNVLKELSETDVLFRLQDHRLSNDLYIININNIVLLLYGK